MANFADALRGGVQNAFCAGLDAVSAGGLMLGGLIQGIPGSDFVNNFGASGTQFMYNTFCNRPLPSGALPQPPYTGGQCNTTYVVRWDYTLKQRNRSNGTILDSSGFTTANLAGAITNIYASTFNTTDGNMFVYADHALGTYSYPLPGSNAFYELTEFSLTGRSATRLDGAPDTCGNLPSQPPAVNPGDNVVNQDITYINNEGDTITVPIVIAFGYASVNIDGHLEIPFNITADIEVPVDVNGTLDFQTGDINFNLGDNSLPPGGGYPCSAPTSPDPDVDDPVLPLPDSNPFEPEPPGQPQKRKVMRGCIVTTTVLAGKETVIYEDSNPDIYVPALGYVNFLVQIGNKTAWTIDIPVKNTRQLIECPWAEGAIDVRGTPRFNNEFQVSPVYITQSIIPQFPE